MLLINDYFVNSIEMTTSKNGSEVLRISDFVDEDSHLVNLT